jgi:probable selenium-dependent hydroxylase accessory protein YqeC
MGILREALALPAGGVIAVVGAGGKTSLMFRLAAELSAEGDAVLTTTTTRIFVPAEGESRCVVMGESLDEILGRCRECLKAGRHVTAAAGLLADGGKLKGLAPETIDAIWRSGLFQWVLVEADGAAGRPLKAPADHEPVIPSAAAVVIAVVGLSAIGQPLDEAWVFRPERFAALTGIAPGAPVGAAAIAAVACHPEGLLKAAPAAAKLMVYFNQADAPADLEAARRITARMRRGCALKIHRAVAGRLKPEPAVLEVLDI